MRQARPVRTQHVSAPNMGACHAMYMSHVFGWPPPGGGVRSALSRPHPVRDTPPRLRLRLAAEGETENLGLWILSTVRVTCKERPLHDVRASCHRS